MLSFVLNASERRESFEMLICKISLLISEYCVRCWLLAALGWTQAVASDKPVTTPNMLGHDTVETEPHFPWNRIGCIISDPEQLLSIGWLSVLIWVLS